MWVRLLAKKYTHSCHENVYEFRQKNIISVFRLKILYLITEGESAKDKIHIK